MKNEKPKFYTKISIIAFSVLMSTFFGALLFTHNLIETSKKNGILNVILFSIFWNVILYKLLAKIIHNGYVIFGITNLLGGIILSTLFWNTYFKEIPDYDHKKVWGPIILFIVLYGGFATFLLIRN